jgi:hypothetical protein
MEEGGWDLQKVDKKAMLDSKATFVFGQMNEPPGARLRVGLTGLTMAEYFRDVEERDVLLFIDNIFRFTQAGSEVSALLGRMPSAVGYQPTLATEMGELQERITSTKKGSITSVQAIYVPADDLTDPAPATTFGHLDAITVLSRKIVEQGIYPAVDPLDSGKFPFLFGQIMLTKEEHTARLTLLAPAELGNSPDYNDLIKHLAQAACDRGALQIMAEARIDSAGEEILSSSGFRSYTDQQIWKLPRLISAGSGGISWIPGIQADNTAAQIFYHRVVPAQIQRLVPAPVFPTTRGMVSQQEGRVVGMALTQFGPKGILLDLILDPSLSSLDEYINALLFHLPYTRSRDVYLRVRDYQGGIASALERLGGLPGDRQRLMVKRLAVHYNAQQAFLVQGFEKQPDVTAPISRTELKNGYDV